MFIVLNDITSKNREGFIMLQNKFPNVRFSKYLDIWKTTKLNRIAEIIGGGTPDTKQSSYWNGGINWFSPTEVGETVYLTKSEKTISQLGLQKSSAKLLPAFKTILFTSRAGIGDVGILTEESATNQGFQSLVVNEGTDVYFLYSYSDQIKKYALKHSAGSTFLEISGKELGKMDLSIPSLPEQSAIGSLFRTLDDLLVSYKDNLANYQSLKATMLSKMFPKDGQMVPEVRLDGFEGEWEEKYIGELADIVRGASPRPIQDPKWFDPNSEIGWLRISDVTSQNGRIHSLEQKISKLGQEKTRVLTEPHLLLSIAATVGKPVVNYVKTGVHDGFLIFMNPKFDREFMFQWLEMYREKWNRYGQPGSQVNLNSDIVKNQKILVPCMEEQQAIGSYFSNLDNLINSHQEKISQLETLKKKLLQDMFI